jgi:hypothetical protein
MESTAYFENIPQEIARRLRAATQQIVVAVAWFTDRDLFDVLCKQAGRGLRVRPAVLNDRINVGASRVNFQRLQNIGGECKGLYVDVRNQPKHLRLIGPLGEPIIQDATTTVP